MWRSMYAAFFEGAGGTDVSWTTHLNIVLSFEMVLSLIATDASWECHDTRTPGALIRGLQTKERYTHLPSLRVPIRVAGTDIFS